MYIGFIKWPALHWAILMLLFIIFHGAFFVKNYKELQFIVVIGIIGTIVDSGLVYQTILFMLVLIQRIFLLRHYG